MLIDKHSVCLLKQHKLVQRAHLPILRLELQNVSFVNRMNTTDRPVTAPPLLDMIIKIGIATLKADADATAADICAASGYADRKPRKTPAVVVKKEAVVKIEAPAAVVAVTHPAVSI